MVFPYVHMCSTCSILFLGLRFWLLLLPLILASCLFLCLFYPASFYLIDFFHFLGQAVEVFISIGGLPHIIDFAFSHFLSLAVIAFSSAAQYRQKCLLSTRYFKPTETDEYPRLYCFHWRCCKIQIFVFN